MRKVALLGMLVFLACGEDDYFVPQNAFDSTCAETLCGWTVDQGAATPSASWHEHERAVSLEGTPAQISIAYGFLPNIDCFSFSFLADIAADAQLTLELDFNNDQRIDATTPVPPARWHRFDLGMRAPPEFRALRVILRKQGAGSVRIASLIIDKNNAGCAYGSATKLASGSMCSTDSTCASGRCTLGQCSSCAGTGCAEGEACRSSDECRDGACAAGVCRACAKQGACEVNTGCSIGGQCASGSCSFGTQPALTKYPGADGVCGDCASDADCGGSFCVLGRCSACRTDSDCASGSVCRYADAYDVTTRACMPRITSPVPRGGLCESQADCASGLACGAVDGRARRCGFACVLDKDCGSNAVCAAPGATKHVDPPATLALLPKWSWPSGRVATCYPVSTSACEVSEQCKGLVLSGFSLGGDGTCCNGECSAGELNPVDESCVGAQP